MLDLYHHGASVCAAKVRMALAEKGLAWTGHYLDIMKGDQYDPDYLKLNPKGVVPTLVDDGEVIRESTLICEYLDEKFPDKPLKPNLPAGKVRMRYWTKFIDEYVHAMCGVLTFTISHRHTLNRLGPKGVEEYLAKTPNPDLERRKREWLTLGLDGPEVVKAVRTFDTMLKDMDAVLADNEWLAGATFSLADIGVIPYVNRLEMLNMLSPWPPEHLRVMDWFERMKERPSFYPAIDEYLSESLAMDMRTNGSKSWPEVKAKLTAAVD
jgi:glutathione S-transferase